MLSGAHGARREEIQQQRTEIEIDKTFHSGSGGSIGLCVSSTQEKEAGLSTYLIRAHEWTGFRFLGQNWIGHCNTKE